MTLAIKVLALPWKWMKSSLHPKWTFCPSFLGLQQLFIKILFCAVGREKLTLFVLLIFLFYFIFNLIFFSLNIHVCDRFLYQWTLFFLFSKLWCIQGKKLLLCGWDSAIFPDYWILSSFSYNCSAASSYFDAWCFGLKKRVDWVFAGTFTDIVFVLTYTINSL